MATSNIATSRSCSQVQLRELCAVLKRPDQMLQFLLASRTSEGACMSERRSRVVSTMLQATLANLSQSHRKQAPAHATRFIVITLRLLQV